MILCGLASSYLTWSCTERKTQALLSGCLTLWCGWRGGVVGGVAGLMVVSCYHYYSLVHHPASARLVRVRWEEVEDPVRRRLAETVERIIERTESLSRPRYTPTLWAAGSWANLALLVMKQSWDKRWRCSDFTTERILLPDGGSVSVDWPSQSQHLPPDAPMVIFLHTITGSSRDTSHYLRAASSRGWRSCVFNRRGHTMPLTSPKFNVMGDAEDTRLMVEHVMAEYPETSYLGMVGISAGSGLLVTYLGKEGDRTPVQAACSLCPAYDISQAFRRLSSLFPAVDSYILQAMKRRFLAKNTEILSTSSPEAVSSCQQAETIQQFVEAHVALAGFNSVEEYYEDSNPMMWVGNIVRPLLIINSEDDMVCLPENIREDVVLQHGGALLLRTKRGAHIAFNEGAFGQGNYLSRVSLDFLESARNLQNMKTE